MQKKLEKILPRLEQIRKELHQNPELSHSEYATAKRIKNYLKTHCKVEILGVAETGVLAIFDSGSSGNTILLRADTDALPIQEINNFNYKSNIASISHKCGHDGHTTILLGVAELLTTFPVKTGKVILLFQPSEENGQGAAAVLQSDFFQNLSIDYAFALHNLPGFKKSEIVLKEHVFNANVKSMIIKFQGKTAHAAEPEKGFNPALAIAEVLQFCDLETNNKPEQEDFFLITTIHINLGEKGYGISAGEGELHLTIRSWNLDIFNQKCLQLENYIAETCKKHHLKSDISWTQEFYANKNEAGAMQYIRSAAIKNDFQIFEMQHPFKWGEDFGLFTQKYKGAMFGLGAGENTPALHNPDYDFPNDILATGIQQFYQIIQEINTN
jgi:amidohydrolase